MKPLILKIAKVLLVVLALICVGAGLIYYNAVNYDMYELKRDKEVLMGDLNADEFARKMVSEMSFEEKVDQMYGESYSSIAKLGINFLVEKRFPHVYVGGNERLNLPPWVLSDGPRGARVMDHEVRAVTTFPVAMARGASWNKDLEYQVHDVIATEMRANKVNYAATPCINLLRHPAWGRAQETYGEDPYLLGVFGVAAVQAIESHHVMACPKHFALNSIENSRFVVDVELDERTLREVYLPHFKKTIQEGKPASLMSAYNKVRGEYSGNNKELLTTILREEWGFEGFISSDWISGTYDGPASVDAGLNVEMPFQDAYSYEALQNGIDQGKISEAQIDELVYQSLKTRIPYAVASDKMDYGLDQILKPESIALARQAAVESMVLLKNDEVLPFESKKEQTVLVLGALANMENTGDHGSSDSTPPYVITPLQGIESLMEQTGASVIYDDGSDLERASKLAKEADQVIVVVGYTAEEEGEYILVNREDIEASAKAGHLIGKKGLGGDRDHLSLLKRDEDLILAAGTVNPKSVVVYIGGSGIEMEAWRSKVPAILFAWYGGMEGGNALADILYGNESPSGKLPFSIAKKESDYPYFNPYTEQIEYGYYHGYTLFDKKNIEVAYPFGFGLSYSAFKTELLGVSSGDEQVNIEVQVSNVGEVNAGEVVQVYVGFKNSEVDRPVKLLRGFEKVFLAPGADKEVHFSIPFEELKWYNPISKQWELEAMTYEVYVGNSSASESLEQSQFSID